MERSKNKTLEDPELEARANKLDEEINKLKKEIEDNKKSK
jgi:hypothetical protein